MIDENEDRVVNVDRECWTLIRSLFFDLLPQLTSLPMYQGEKLNEFVKMLVKTLPLDSISPHLYRMFSFLFDHRPSHLFMSNTTLYAISFLSKLGSKQ